MTHYAGFINIVGRPNVGKSTLMNALVGERMSIITHKSQTTRHRIIGILSGEDFQMIFSDTPGFVRKPSYKMHETMNAFVRGTFDDADILIFMVEVNEQYEEDDPLWQKVKSAKVPVLLLVNKVDLHQQDTIVEYVNAWSNRHEFEAVIPISASNQAGTPAVFQLLKKLLPQAPPYYPKDQLTDRPERFFISEIIREQILLQYKQEIPYATEVEIESFKEDKSKKLIRIRAIIYVMRNTQKSILIGKGGKAIKHLGIEARKSIEKFLASQVYLELYVKVKDNWRDDDRALKGFGYQ